MRWCEALLRARYVFRLWWNEGINKTGGEATGGGQFTSDPYITYPKIMKRSGIGRAGVLPSIAMLLALNAFTTTASFAQDNPVTALTYYATEAVKTQSPPSFPGGHEKLEAFIRAQVEDSPDEIRLGRKVSITAKINASGKVVELKPTDNGDPQLQKELTRMAARMPKWQPGIVNGKGVVTDYTFVLRGR